MAAKIDERDTQTTLIENLSPHIEKLREECEIVMVMGDSNTDVRYNKMREYR